MEELNAEKKQLKIRIDHDEDEHDKKVVNRQQDEIIEIKQDADLQVKAPLPLPPTVNFRIGNSFNDWNGNRF